MAQPRIIYFVYDADGGILGKVKYWISKNILKKSSACELCDITHGTFFVRDSWLKFIAELEQEYKVEVLHRNELPINIRERNFLFPCVIVETDKELKEIIDRASFKDFEILSNVTELRKQLFEKLL
tara:strand:+ start:1121 stop:1498 length:378 start_codon:yes stop_codon:yes gene_type:complete